MGAGLGRPAVDDARAKREARQPVSAITPSEWRVEQVEVDRRLAALQALEEARRGELDEVAVARVATPPAASGGCARSGRPRPCPASRSSTK